VNKYHNRKHYRYGGVEIPSRPELEEHLDELPPTSSSAKNSLWPPLDELLVKHQSSRKSLILEVCSGLAWHLATPTTLV
jgi:hypothetical protein